jgi:hypothetical protein
MQPCVIDPCWRPTHSEDLAFCTDHHRQIHPSIKDRLFWTHADWVDKQNDKTAKQYRKAVRMAVAELTAKVDVEAGRAS